MFRKLKLQFILTNLAIITALFVSLTIGAYILLQINMINHAKVFSQRLAMSINSDEFLGFPFQDNDGPPDDHHRFSEPSQNNNRPSPPFFVETDPTGKIMFQSYRELSEEVNLDVLVERVFKINKTTGIISFLHSKFFYYKTSLERQPGILIIFQDLKQEKNIQQSLVISLIITGIIYLLLSMVGSLYMAKRAIGPIQKAWQQQNNFLADASHELRTPLAIIQTNLEVVLSNPQETVVSQINWLGNIKEELQQMTVLVNSLLFLARVDSQQYVMEKKYFSLDKVVIRVSEAFKPIVAAKNISLCTSTKGEKIMYYGDESNIRQVLEILLDNAIQHTPTGGKIALDLNQVDKRILLTITDTGEGIAAEHLDKIFDRFYQVDASRSKGKAGLGLSIAKCIIENHGGTISVTSKLGAGTKFTVQLPLLKINTDES